MIRSARLKTVFKGLMVGGLALSTLVACGSGGGNSGEGDPTDAPAISGEGIDDGTKLTMWVRAGFERQANNAARVYNETHQNQVVVEPLPDADVEGRVGTGAQTGELPALISGDVVRIPYWAEQGILLDLTDQIDALPNVADLQAGHIDAGTIAGSKYTLPFVTDISVVVWNKDLYKKAGLDPEKGPSTLDEFVAQAKAVAALGEEGVSGSYFGGQCGGCGVFTLFPPVWAAGDEVMNEEGTESLLAGDSAQAVYSAWRQLAETPNGLGASSKEETGATWTAAFLAGKVGVQPYAFFSAMQAWDEVPFEIGVTALAGPTGGESTFLGGDALGIAATTDTPAQAWNFLQWLMTEEAQQKVLADEGDTAANLKVLANGYAGSDPRIQYANSLVQYGRTPVSVAFNEAFNAPGSPWQLLLQSQIWGDPGDVVAENQAITDILDQ